MENRTNSIREFFSEYEIAEWIKFNLPDLLWVFGFTSVMLIIWNGIRSRIKIFYILLPVFIGLTSEFTQYFYPTFGTFDPKDLVFYSMGFLLSIIILKTINQSKNEKQITTLL